MGEWGVCVGIKSPKFLESQPQKFLTVSYECSWLYVSFYLANRTPQLWIYPCCIKSWSSEARYYSSQQRRGTHHLALLCYLFAHTKIINKVGDCINFLQLFCTVEVFKQWPACRLALYSFLCLQLHRPVLIQIYAFYNS